MASLLSYVIDVIWLIVFVLNVIAVRHKQISFSKNMIKSTVFVKHG